MQGAVVAGTIAEVEAVQGRGSHHFHQHNDHPDPCHTCDVTVVMTMTTMLTTMLHSKVVKTISANRVFYDYALIISPKWP